MRREARIEIRRVTADPNRLENEIGVFALPIGQQSAAVSPEIQPLDHVAHHGMIDARDGQAEDQAETDEDLRLTHRLRDRPFALAGSELHAPLELGAAQLISLAASCKA